MDTNKETTNALIPSPLPQEPSEPIVRTEPVLLPESEQEPVKETDPESVERSEPKQEPEQEAYPVWPTWMEPEQAPEQGAYSRWLTLLESEREPTQEANPEPEKALEQETRPRWLTWLGSKQEPTQEAEQEPEQKPAQEANPEPEQKPAQETEPETEQALEQEVRPKWLTWLGPEQEPTQEAKQEPEQKPAQGTEPEPKQEFEQEVRPRWTTWSEPEQEPEQEAYPIWPTWTESGQEPTQEAKQEPEQKPAQETEPETEQEPKPEPEAKPAPTPLPEPAPPPKPEPKSPQKLLGEALMARGKLDALALDRAQRLYQDTPNEKFANLLITLGLVAPIDIAEALAQIYSLPLVRADRFPELPILEERISPRFLRESKVLPLHENEEELTLAMVDPSDTFTVEAFTMATGKRIVPQVALPSEIEAALERLYGAGRSAVGQIVGDIGMETDEFGLTADVQQLKDLASEAPVIRLVSLIITNALSMRASDIHIEPFEDRLIVRYRIDGVLHEIESPPKRLSAAVISRVKIIANLDIAERRLPQDGRIRLRSQGKDIDLRVSTVPTMHGESVVMRILDKGGVALDFHKLGFSDRTLDRFLSALMQPNGILLVTGPTGSGKTTTLYTALDRVNKPDVKILTVEDPVEYQMPGINQIQVKPQIDLTFANALRSIVRQDPDIIMIGEIRDLETAQIAVQSALTGHLVLSTVHTNDAASTVNRLLDMGVEDYLLTSTVIGIQAQRLVRTLCEHCKEPYTVLPEMVDELGLRRLAPTAQQDITLWHARGCKECANTGYMGRVCILEVLLMTDAVRSLVMRHATSGEIKEQALADGMGTMYEDGLRKALAGVTTIEEVLRATRED